MYVRFTNVIHRLNPLAGPVFREYPCEEKKSKRTRTTSKEDELDEMAIEWVSPGTSENQNSTET